MDEHCDRRWLVDRHFQARVTPAQEAELRAHLPDCPVCQARYQRHGLLAELTRARPSRADRLAVGLGLAPPGGTRRAALLRLAVPALAAAAGVALLVTRPHRSVEAEFAVRGRVPPPAAALEVFRVPPGAAPVRAQGWVGAGDELAFAYRNPEGFRRLLVFGLDQKGAIHWFHPAWTDAAQDPAAIAAAPGLGPHELGEAIKVDLPGRQLLVIGVFTNEALSVREVERRLRAGLLGKVARVDVPLEIRR